MLDLSAILSPNNIYRLNILNYIDKRILILLIIIAILAIGVGWGLINHQNNSNTQTNNTNTTNNNTTVKNATSSSSQSGQYGYCPLCVKALTSLKQTINTQGKICHDCASNPYYETDEGAKYANKKLAEAYPEEYAEINETLNKDYEHYDDN